MSGNNGADTIYGHAGGDTISGNNGQDNIDLGLSDGASDTVNIKNISSNSHADTIYSFASSEDELKITNTSLTSSANATGVIAVSGVPDATTIYVDTISNLGSLGVNIGDKSTTYSSGGYAYASDTGALFYDSDGNWTSGSVQVATVYVTALGGADTAANLVATDFQFG